METKTMVLALSVGCLLVNIPAQAQLGMIRTPAQIQAIDTHMQQSRTLEQRKAMEANNAGAAQAKPDSSAVAPVKKTSKKKAKAKPVQ